MLIEYAKKLPNWKARLGMISKTFQQLSVLVMAGVTALAVADRAKNEAWIYLGIGLVLFLYPLALYLAPLTSGGDD